MVASHLSSSLPSEMTPQDEALIHSFVDSFLQGHSILLSTRHLRTEPSFDSLQLIANKEGVIATAYLQTAPIRALVRQSSIYWQALHKTMVAQEFYPVSRLTDSHQYVYRYCSPPEDYVLHCTLAKELWRACWGRGFSLRSGIPLDLIVWGKIASQQREQWHSLRGMDCIEGRLQAKVLGGSLTFSGSDWLVWAKQSYPGQNQSGSVSRPRPDLRGYYRLRQ